MSILSKRVRSFSKRAAPIFFCMERGKESIDARSVRAELAACIPFTADNGKDTLDEELFLFIEIGMGG